MQCTYITYRVQNTSTFNELKLSMYQLIRETETENEIERAWDKGNSHVHPCQRCAKALNFYKRETNAKVISHTWYEWTFLFESIFFWFHKITLNEKPTLFYPHKTNLRIILKLLHLSISSLIYKFERKVRHQSLMDGFSSN